MRITHLTAVHSVLCILGRLVAPGSVIGVHVVGSEGRDAHLAVLGNAPELRRLVIHDCLDTCSDL